MLKQSLLLFVVVLCTLPRYSEAYTAWGMANCHTDCTATASDCEDAYQQFISNGIYTVAQKTDSRSSGTCKVTIINDGDEVGCQITDKYLRNGKSESETFGGMIQSGGFDKLKGCATHESNAEKCGFVKMLGDSSPSVKSTGCGTWEVKTSSA